MNTVTMRIIVVLFLLVLYYFCCKPNNSQDSHENAASVLQQDTTVYHVVKLTEEEKVDSVRRWLWNLMTNRKTHYDKQLEATRLWPLLEGHIKCEGLITGGGVR